MVHGDVQGVGYRSRVVAIARDLGLVGFIRNLPDGRAKVTAEGGTDILERFVKAIKIDNALIKVDEIDYEYSEPTREFESFYKLVGKGETDERLNTAAGYLKELISVTKNGFSDLKEVIIDESQKTREEMRSTFGSRFSKMEDDIDHIKDGIGRS